MNAFRAIAVGLCCLGATMARAADPAAAPVLQGAAAPLAAEAPASPTEPTAAELPPKVAVVELAAYGDGVEADAGRMVAELLTGALARTGRFRLTERVLLDKVLAEQELAQSGLLDEAQRAARIGRLFGVSAVVTGSVMAWGGQTVVSARLVDVESGAIRATGQVSAAARGPLLGELSALAEALAGGTGATDCARAQALFDRAGGAPFRERPGLLEQALGLCPDNAVFLNEVAVLRENAGRLDEANDLYRRAAALDPADPAPYAGLGDVAAARGDPEAAAAAYDRYLAALPGWQATHPGDPVLGYAEVYRAKRARLPTAASAPVVQAAAIQRSLTRGIGRHQAPPRLDLSNILFDYDSDALRPESQAQLAELARALGDPTLVRDRIRIAGHTDSLGSAAYNQALSERRAQAVRQALALSHRVDPARLDAVGLGESQPAVPEVGPEDRASNRRVSFENLGP